MCIFLVIRRITYFQHTYFFYNIELPCELFLLKYIKANVECINMSNFKKDKQND